MAKLKIKVKKPWIAYPGSTIQQNYAEDLKHGYLLWDINHSTDFDVKFFELPNPKPFVTLNWNGDFESTIADKTDFNKGTRFRIKSDQHIVQGDVSKLTKFLKKNFSASEVTFKQDHQTSTEVIDAGTSVLIREDLRNSDVLYKLLQDYYRDVKISKSDWDKVKDLIEGYVKNISTDTSSIIRNTKWSLRELSFDNLFNYGEDNIINFDKLNGIVGVFGPNRSGKSSIVGAILYTLFNTSDRGNLKNKDICNIRKSFCYGKAVISINGNDYVIERQTTKQETKQGEIYAPTVLNFYKLEGKSKIDLAGEQRNNTEKKIRQRLGTVEDVTMTSMSTQGDVNQFIEHGSTRRRQALSRFLDLDVCWKIFEQAKSDLKDVKAVLRQIPDRDYSTLIAEKKNQSQLLKSELVVLTEKANNNLVNLTKLQSEVASKQNIEIVTQDEINSIRNTITSIESRLNRENKNLIQENNSIVDLNEKLNKINSKLESNKDISVVKQNINDFKQLKKEINDLNAKIKSENESLKRKERSLTILNEVPCGEQFLNCKFIKDAIKNKALIPQQEDKITSLTADLNIKNTEESLEKFKNINKKIKLVENLEKMSSLISPIKLKIARHKIKVEKITSEIDKLTTLLNKSKLDFEKKQEIFLNKDNEVAVKLQGELELLKNYRNEIDKQKLEKASLNGRIQSEIESLHDEQKNRKEVLQKMKSFELIYNGFNKKGIPNVIVSSQLPAINVEMSKVLSGITDYVVEMQREGDNERIEIYINYGDSRRPLELGSGMEKFIASIAIRVAMINISTLPKPDMFVIDEGFGSLDDSNVEACNRLLTSLKNYFKTIIVISHVDAIKDIADHVVEITKNEKDSQVSVK